MVNTNMFEFKHPKYYTELRKRNKSDQVISDEASTEATSVHPGPGLRSYPLSGNGGKLDSLQTLADKAQAPSRKQQASSAKLLKHQAASIKPQATSIKLQAASDKLQDS